MNRKNILATFILIAGLATANAQSWSLGAAGIYGDDIKRAGVHLRGYYNLPGNRVCFGPEFSNFFKRTIEAGGEEATIRLRELNFNVHYVFHVAEGWGVYPLTGLNVSFESEEIEIAGESEKFNETAVGGNLGFGVHRSLHPWEIFAEYDRLFSDLSQNSFLIGAFFTFGKRNKQHEHE